MEFKYMLVGNEFYGDRKAFDDGANPMEEDDDAKFARQATAKSEGQDPNSEKNLSDWSCHNYDAVMSGRNDSQIDFKVKSKNGGESLLLSKQSN